MEAFLPFEAPMAVIANCSLPSRLVGSGEGEEKEKSVRRATWFSICIPLGVAGDGRSQCHSFQQLVLEGALRAEGCEIA